jgi:four helix bundle protein
MALEVESVALELVAALRPLMPRIRRAERSLADQLSRAANSIVLNICETAYSDPGNRRAGFHTAAGSANEVRGALKLARAWG